MLIIGVDPGLQRTGIALLDDGILVETKLIETVKDDGPETQRIQDIARAVHQYIADRPELHDADEPAIVAIESQHFQQVRHKHEPTEREFKAEAAKAGDTIRVAQVAGAVMAEAARFGLEVIEVSPSRAKKAVTGEQQASKEQVRHMVAATHHVDFDELSEHEADAIAVATGTSKILIDRRLKEAAK